MSFRKQEKLGAEAGYFYVNFAAATEFIQESTYEKFTIDKLLYDKHMQNVPPFESFNHQAELQTIALYEQQEKIRGELSIQSEFILAAAGNWLAIAIKEEQASHFKFENQKNNSE